ncbi:hypothetical protein MOV73_005095 [Raoultella ornithinolytica]
MYASGKINPCRIKCGNLSLKVGRKWRLLSQDDGGCWKVMSHENTTNLKTGNRNYENRT